MAALAASIADTVAGMQRVLTKRHYSSDSDEPYLQPSNRGNKLKRKARYISSGLDGESGGPEPYRKSIKHAGYTRAIIHRNPKRYDEDGDELATDDEDDEADRRAAEEDPYAEIRLERLLAPLTSAAALADHPSMSFAYTSTILTDMAQQACEMVQKERKTLCHAKGLLTELRGDSTWIPAGKMETSYDDEIFDTENIYHMILASVPIGNARQKSRNGSRPGINGGAHASTSPRSEPDGTVVSEHVDGGSIIPTGQWHGSDHTTTLDEPPDMKDEAIPLAIGDIQDTSITPMDHETSPPVLKGIRVADSTQRDGTPANEKGNENKADVQHPDDGFLEGESNGILPSVETGQLRRTQILEEGDTSGPLIDNEDLQDGSRSPPRRITRAQAQADKATATSHSESPEDWLPPQIHPLFLVPASAKSDPDFGLPADEALETRNLLTAYVQKQEEVCRVAERLYSGLLKAERQRKAVSTWCKAEGHVGQMSDGEDWYDKEEWGLEDDLRKGHAEEEEETAVQGKKTRRRV